MKKLLFVALALAPGLTATAQAQESPFSATLGVRAWYTQWDTFSYRPSVVAGERHIIQVPAEAEFVLIPVLSMRYGDFVSSLSVFPSTTYDFVLGGQGKRKEFDINVGYYITPGVALTLGYKQFEQSDADTGFRYRLTGPVIGANATAPLGGNFALYGSLALGRLTPSSSDVDLDADYQLGEVGFAYSLATPSVTKAISFTVGYRTQVLNSKEALPGQDARDLTDGVAIGLLVTF
jgi:hypothetical protein